jgi:type VII secretion-associated serine protease mycosin
MAQPAWALTRLRPDLAWPLSRGAGVTVAVIDSGVSPSHPALEGKVLEGRDFVVGGTGQCDENGHGTLIAGLIAGREVVSAEFRFYGIAPDATILPVRVLRDQQRSYETDLSERIADAVMWAVDRGDADIINLSLTTAPTPELEAAIEHAIAAGAVVVAAAGNEGESGRTEQVAYPAAYRGVIAVAGVDANNQHVSSSTPGDYVDVAAPGVLIAGPAPAGGGFLWSEQGGTSFAAAYVSGVAALVRAYHPALTTDQIAERIIQTAEQSDGQWSPEVGFGVVDPARAVGALTLATPPSEPTGRLVAPAPPAPARDPLSNAAPWIAATGALAAVIVLVAVPVARQGRRRGWRSGANPTR